jgi:hypothetical protein
LIFPRPVDGPEVITVAVLAPNSTWFQSFSVPREIITDASSYFRKLFTPGSSVSQFKHVDLIDESPKAFSLLLRYLGGSGDVALQNHRRETHGGISATALLVMAHVLATKLEMEDICNQLMDRVLHQYNVKDACNGDLGGNTIFQVRACKVKDFLIGQLAWTLAEKGFSSLCDCEEGLVECCKWCSFLAKAGADVPKLMCRLRYYEDQKQGRGGRGRLSWNEMEPRKQGHCFWHTHRHTPRCPETLPACAQCEEETEQEAGSIAEENRQGGDNITQAQEIRNEAILAGLTLEDLPRTVSEGDGSALQDEVLSATDFGDFESRGV